MLALATAGASGRAGARVGFGWLHRRHRSRARMPAPPPRASESRASAAPPAAPPRSAGRTTTPAAASPRLAAHRVVDGDARIRTGHRKAAGQGQGDVPGTERPGLLVDVAATAPGEALGGAHARGAADRHDAERVAAAGADGDDAEGDHHQRRQRARKAAARRDEGGRQPETGSAMAATERPAAASWPSRRRLRFNSASGSAGRHRAPWWLPWAVPAPSASSAGPASPSRRGCCRAGAGSG